MINPKIVVFDYDELHKLIPPIREGGFAWEIPVIDGETQKAKSVIEAVIYDRISEICPSKVALC